MVIIDINNIFNIDINKYILFIDNDEIRTNRLNSLKMAIETNQLTIDVCDKFIDEMDNLKSEEMKEIGKIIVNKIIEFIRKRTKDSMRTNIGIYRSINDL